MVEFDSALNRRDWLGAVAGLGLAGLESTAVAWAA